MIFLLRHILVALLLLGVTCLGSGCNSLDAPENLSIRPWTEPDANANYGNGIFTKEFNQGR